MNLPPETSDWPSEMVDVWVRIDIDALRDWPDYTDEDRRRFAHINWPEACRIALSLVDEGAPHAPFEELPDGLDDAIFDGLKLLLQAQPIVARPHQITDGSHRLLAMKAQAVRFTVGVAAVEKSSSPPEDDRQQGD